MALQHQAADKDVSAHQAHGQVAGQVAGEHGRGDGIGVIHLLGHANGGDHALDEDDGQHDQQQRGQVFAQFIHHRVLVEGEEEHQGEEHHHGHPNGDIGEQGLDSQLMGGGARPGQGGAHAHQDTADDVEPVVEPGVDVAHQGLYVAHVVYRPEGGDRQDDAGDQDANGAQQPLGTGGQANLGRENQVARAKHSGKQGQAYHHAVNAPMLLFHTQFPPFLVVRPLFQSRWYTISPSTIVSITWVSNNSSRGRSKIFRSSTTRSAYLPTVRVP